MSASVRIEHGDCRDVLKTMADASVDAVATDPPYGIKFMAKAWDHGGTAFDPALWAEVLRVLKPGGHLVAFGGTRTYHRLACAIEDAGFDIRDQIGWVFGSGFPKSHDVGKGIDKAAGAEREVVGRLKGAASTRTESLGEFSPEYDQTTPATDAARQWQGWGTALKPAWEPICLARKPLIGTVAENVLGHGTGALNIDGCRVEGGERETTTGGMGRKANPVYGQFARPTSEPLTTTQGRWPANVIHDGSEEVLAAFPESDHARGNVAAKDHGADYNASSYQFGGRERGFAGDNGSAARFFYSAKADAVGNGRDGEASAERRYTEEGSTNFAALPGQRRDDPGSAARFFYSAKADAADRLGSKHPTVKPVDLMAYLCRLITPPGGTVLDPFAGSGSTGMACMREGFDCILIEREAEYIADIKGRLRHVDGSDTPLFEFGT